MWSIAICDDNRRECNEMEELLDTYCEEKKIALETELFYDGFSLCERMEAGKRYDLIFLDILMCGMDGIQVGSRIRHALDDEEVELVYMSCVMGDADLLLQNRPIGFMGKPIQKEEVYRTVDYARKLGDRFRKWFLYKKDRISYQVPYKEILYFQSVGRKVELHTLRGVHEFYGKPSEILEEGLPEQFVQIHQSYIINRDFVVRFDKERVYLKGKEGYFSISQTYRQSAGQWLLGFPLPDYVK